MKTKNKSIYGLVLAILIAVPSYGQQIDQNRMDRDLKIAENILGTLSNNDSYLYSRSRNIESNYIPGYGVIFSLPQSSWVFVDRSRGGFAVVAPSDGSSSSYTYSYSTSDDKEKVEGDKEEPELQKKFDVKAEENMTTFLVDYADLIGQLKPTDRILINVKSRSNQVWISGSNLRSKRSKGKTAEILKSDLILFKQGKASREETIKKIKFGSDEDKPKDRDLELFSSIFARLFEPDLSTTYYTSSRTINYERLPNLGAIYSMRVYSSTSDDGLHTIRTTGEGGLTKEERNRKVNAMYPEFEQMVKENILDYGRTIKSLKPSEMLIVKIRLTECKGCEMPKNIEVSIKASTFVDYDSGKISRENALKAISIKKSE